MLYTIMKYVRNFFQTPTQESGTFKIEASTISLPFVSANNYILIEGSAFNDGVYKYPATNLADETFDGTITVLHPPKEFLDLVDEIETFCEKNPVNNLQSESFGGYSYSKASGNAGGVADWKDVYRGRLNTWRKM